MIERQTKERKKGEKWSEEGDVKRGEEEEDAESSKINTTRSTNAHM
jgi:hypothetical protein